jgi:hypothetical protein
MCRHETQAGQVEEDSFADRKLADTHVERVHMGVFFFLFFGR